MSFLDRLNTDMKEAMKAREKARVDCLRMLKSKLLEREIALRAKHGKQRNPTDDEALEVIVSYAKQRRESIAGYRQGGREDLATKEEAELAIVEEYLPRQLSEEEIGRVVAEAIAETGASSPKEMGTVMKAVLARVKGAADGKLVSRLVRERLAGTGSSD